MSDPFSHKDYGEYFQALSKRSNPEKPARVPVAVKPKTVRRRRARIRPSFLFACAAVLVLGILAVTVLTKKGDSPPTVKAKAVALEETRPTAEPKEEPIVFKETENTLPAPDGNDAEGLLVVCSDTDEIVTARNPKKRLYPASTTKIMTVLVAAEHAENLADTFEMTRQITDEMYLAEATVAGFSAGEEVTVADLIYGTILSSGGDAALGLAEKLAGGQAAFVEWMNQKATELGLCDTHFTNVTGLYDANHYTTAYDLAIILKSALKNPICKEVLSTYQHTTQATPQHPEGITLSATLFNYMYGTEPETATILGGKTGYVNESGYCIATYGKNNETGTEYLAVTMKNSSRWPAIHGQIDLYKQFAK